MNKQFVKGEISTVEGIKALMDILGGADFKEETKAAPVMAEIGQAPFQVEGTPRAGKTVVTPKSVKKMSVAAPVAIAPVEKKNTAPDVVYGHSGVISINGKKTHVGPKKKGRGGAGAAKNDPVKEMLKDLYIKVISESKAYGAETFSHSSEGYVIRMPEADYTVKVTKSKANKFELEEGEKAEIDFSIRGKVKNSAPGIARAIYLALENEIQNSNLEFKIVNAKASGVVIQGKAGEYTVKISKKRDRVGFEAEKGAAYEK